MELAKFRTLKSMQSSALVKIWTVKRKQSRKILETWSICQSLKFAPYTKHDYS